MRKFSIIVPSWQDYGYLDLCLKSLIDCSEECHEILIHLNTFDDKYEILADIYDSGYTKTKENMGIAYGANRGAERATTEWLFFVDSDCVFLPGWDIELDRAIDKWGENNIFPVTKIEPKGYNPACIIKDYGRNPEEFRFTEIIDDTDSLKRGGYQVVSAGPWLSPKDLFEGFDERMFPGWHIDADAYVTAYSIDQDMRFIKPWNSMLYHFATTGTGRIGNVREREKWTRNALDIFDNKWKKIFPGINSQNYTGFIEQPVEGLKGRSC